MSRGVAGVCTAQIWRHDAQCASVWVPRCLLSLVLMPPQFCLLRSNKWNQLVHFIFVPAIWWTVAGAPQGTGCCWPSAAWERVSWKLCCVRSDACLQAAALPHAEVAQCPPPRQLTPPPTHHSVHAVWLAYTPEAFAVSGLASRLPTWAAAAAPYLRFNGSFFLAAGYSLYYLLLEPLAGGSWTGGG